LGGGGRVYSIILLGAPDYLRVQQLSVGLYCLELLKEHLQKTHTVFLLALIQIDEGPTVLVHRIRICQGMEDLAVGHLLVIKGVDRGNQFKDGLVIEDTALPSLGLVTFLTEL